jgi:hypothetical protein
MIDAEILNQILRACECTSASCQRWLNALPTMIVEAKGEFIEICSVKRVELI